MDRMGDSAVALGDNFLSIESTYQRIGVALGEFGKAKAQAATSSLQNAEVFSGPEKC